MVDIRPRSQSDAISLLDIYISIIYTNRYTIKKIFINTTLSSLHVEFNALNNKIFQFHTSITCLALCSLIINSYNLIPGIN